VDDSHHSPAGAVDSVAGHHSPAVGSAMVPRHTVDEALSPPHHSSVADTADTLVVVGWDKLVPLRVGTPDYSATEVPTAVDGNPSSERDTVLHSSAAAAVVVSGNSNSWVWPPAPHFLDSRNFRDSTNHHDWKTRRYFSARPLH
jgi:hypothetical protein